MISAGRAGVPRGHQDEMSHGRGRMTQPAMVEVDNPSAAAAPQFSRRLLTQKPGLDPGLGATSLIHHLPYGAKMPVGRLYLSTHDDKFWTLSVKILRPNPGLTTALLVAERPSSSANIITLPNLRVTTRVN